MITKKLANVKHPTLRSMTNAINKAAFMQTVSFVTISANKIISLDSYVNIKPFPHTDAFGRLCNRGLLNKSWQISNFPFLTMI